MTDDVKRCPITKNPIGTDTVCLDCDDLNQKAQATENETYATLANLLRLHAVIQQRHAEMLGIPRKERGLMTAARLHEQKLILDVLDETIAPQRGRVVRTEDQGATATLSTECVGTFGKGEEYLLVPLPKEDHP